MSLSTLDALRRSPLLLTCCGPLLLATACGSGSSALIQSTTPHNGATAVDTSIEPKISVVGGAGIDLLPATARKVVLYDVSGSGRKAIGGQVVAEGDSLTYEPTQDLEPGHDYQLEVDRSSFTGSDFEQLDGAEWPEEQLSWPYKLGFSTRTGPRIRAAYLDGATRIVIRFSQKMNPAVSETQVQVLDLGGKQVQLERPVWSDQQQSLQVSVKTALQASSLYTLKVGRKTAGADGTLLDGNDNGKPGENDDDFSANFTGSQRIIISRLP